MGDSVTGMQPPTLLLQQPRILSPLESQQQQQQHQQQQQQQQQQYLTN